MSKFKLNLDDQTASNATRKWSLTDIVLPIKVIDTNNVTHVILKNIEEVTTNEFLNWVKQVMPLSDDMMNIYIQDFENAISLKQKNTLFNTIVYLHDKKWLFGQGNTDAKDPSLKWN